MAGRRAGGHRDIWHLWSSSWTPGLPSNHSGYPGRRRRRDPRAWPASDGPVYPTVRDRRLTASSRDGWRHRHREGIVAMMTITLNHYLLLSALIFSIGLFGALSRK